MKRPRTALTWEDTDSPVPQVKGCCWSKHPHAALARPQQECLESDVGEELELGLLDRPFGLLGRRSVGDCRAKQDQTAGQKRNNRKGGETL